MIFLAWRTGCVLEPYVERQSGVPRRRSLGGQGELTASLMVGNVRGSLVDANPSRPHQKATPLMLRQDRL